MDTGTESIFTAIWNEEPEHDNPFAASSCFCHGYDVYGDILSKASWIEYLFLLFSGERPSAQHANLLEGLAISLSHPGIRDPSVHAAMSGGAGGSTNASCLMAALAVGAGQLGGAHEVFLAMERWIQCGQNLDAWQDTLQSDKQESISVWPATEHPPGFDPRGKSCATPVQQTLSHLAAISPATNLAWLQKQRSALETMANMPLAFTGVAAAAFRDLNLTPEQGEMLYLFFRLPGAAVHALEQKKFKGRRFPFFFNRVRLEDDHFAPTREQ